MMRLSRYVGRDALLCFVKPGKLFCSSVPPPISFPCGQLLLPLLLALSVHGCVQEAQPSVKRKRGGRLHSRGLLPYNNHLRRMFRKIRLCEAHNCWSHQLLELINISSIHTRELITLAVPHGRFFSFSLSLLLSAKSGGSHVPVLHRHSS